MNKQNLCVLFFISLLNITIADAAPSLCAPTERILFSCMIGKKAASVCASTNLSRTAGYLQYRFGHNINEIELKYPISYNSRPKANFLFSDVGQGGRGSLSNLQFRIGNYKYTIYRFRHAVADEYAGIAVQHKNAPPRFLNCQVLKATDEVIDDLQSLYQLDLPLVDEAQFVEGPE